MPPVPLHRIQEESEVCFKKKVKFLVHLKLGLPHHSSDSGRQANKYNPSGLSGATPAHRFSLYVAAGGVIGLDALPVLLRRL